MDKKIELLAPAGDFESLKIAIINGADAVYFGAKNFNARAKADNFGEEMAKAISFVHMYGARAYLTLNTLIENEEIDDLIKTAKFALDSGIDAFIVQDFGVLNILKNCFKEVEIHTSTQMAVNNYQGALMAQKLGAKRVVLSRETNIEDIKLIKEKTNLEIEYFIQGALCVCFSGNCYMSSYLFGKSGNKGKCLQPCRLPYKAMLKGKTIGSGYLLSAKDLNMSKRLKELIEAGVDSFKIEGRLRRLGYIAGVTKTYRKIIDQNLACSNQDQNNLKKLFNRGDFIEGYLNGNDSIIDSNIQGHKGIYIGKVVGFNKGKNFNIIKIESSHNISKGDGLKILRNNKEQTTISAYDIKQKNNIYEITSTSNVAVGDIVNLILDSKLENEVLQTENKLPLNFKLIAKLNNNIELQYSFKNCCGKVTGEVCEKANNIAINYEDALSSLQKLNDTNFFLSNFEMEADNVFVRKQTLNNLRRMAVLEIEQKFISNKDVKVNKKYINDFISKKVTIKENTNTFDFGEKFDSSANYLIIRPSNYKTFDYDKITHKNAFLYIPSFLRNSDILVLNKVLDKYKNLGVFAENIGALNYNRKTIFGGKLNLKNIFSIKEIINENVVAIFASPEISDENFEILKQYFNVDFFKSDFKKFDLMTFVHCPIKTLFKNTCKDCKFAQDIIYEMEDGNKFKLNRNVIANCYFFLQKI